MKHLTILIIAVFALNTASFAQSDCKYNGSESAIVAELSKRNTNTGKHKLNQEELKKIAGYWVADCKCKKGVETRGEAEKLYQDAFLRREISAYQDGQNYKKDLSVFGDLEPPFAVFTISSCLTGNNSVGEMSLESSTNCEPEATRLSELDGQLSAYAGQFFVAYCQCINGVPSQEYADNLVATMKSTHKSFDDFRGTTPRLRTQPLTSCDVVPGSEYGNGSKPLERNFGNMLIGGEISDLAGGFIHEIAQFSNNSKIKNLSNEVGQIQEKYGELRGFNNQISGIFGVNPADNEAMQIYEVAQSIEIGITIAKTLFGETEDTPLSESQKQVLEVIKLNNRNLKLIYNEIASLELSSNLDSTQLLQLFRKEKQFEEYNAFTASDRYLYYWWVLSEYPDIDAYNLEIKKIQGYTLNELLNNIYLLKEKLNNSYNVKEPPHMANKNQAFANVNKQIEQAKALYFKAINYNDISNYYLSKFIGVEEFSPDKAKAVIREIIESNPSDNKVTVSFSENEIAIKNLKKSGKIFSCYSIPLNQGEYKVENEVIFSTTYFHLTPKAYKSPIKLNSCEDNSYYKTVQIMKTKESTIIGTQLQNAINSLVKYYQFIEFEKNNFTYFEKAPVIQSLINQETKHYSKKQGQKLITKNIYVSDNYRTNLNLSNSKWGYVNKDGVNITPHKYDLTSQFSEGMGLFLLNNKYGFVNEAGEEVIEAKFQLAYDFSNGLALVSLNGDRYGFIDKNGEYVITPKYQFANSFKESLAVVYYYGKYGFIDKNGNEVVPLKYDDAESFSNGLAIVKKGNKYGYINLKGKEVIPMKYKAARDYDGKKVEVKKGRNWIYLDIDGNELK
jgi:hypothetical protein